MARFYVSPYKTFEYDLAMAGNCSIMSEVIKNSVVTSWSRQSNQPQIRMVTGVMKNGLWAEWKNGALFGAQRKMVSCKNC